MLLDRPLFWIADQTYLVAAFLSALVFFFLVRWIALPIRTFLLLDSADLASVSVSGI